MNNQNDREARFGLIKRAAVGDQAAFDELTARCRATGDDFRHWLDAAVVAKQQTRVSTRDLVLRHSVTDDISGIQRDLSKLTDGPSEDLIVRRAALSAVNARLADLEHVRAIADGRDTATIDALDRRRDRAHKRLLQCLEALAQVRRLNRPAVQVNVGDGNVNILKS